MKSFFIFAFLVIYSHNIFSQQEPLPFNVVDEAPFIKECYDPNKDSKECFKQNLSDYFQSNLITPKTLKGEGKAYATFEIAETGAIKDVKVRATDKDQEQEVRRVLSELKIASPARHNGEAVAITYATPVVFKQTMYDSYSAFFETRAKNLPHAIKTAYPPLFKNCVAENDKKSCFEETVEDLIRKNVKEAKPGAVINYYFEIDENAEVINPVVLSHNDKTASKLAK